MKSNYFIEIRRMTRDNPSKFIKIRRTSTGFIAKSTDYRELHQNNNQGQNLDLYGYGA